MRYIPLGESGLKVSPLCLGTMMFGDRTDREEAARIVASAKQAGINFIDTADVYAKGESERVVGDLIRGDREHWVLATKFRAWRMAEVIRLCDELGMPRPVCVQPYYNAMNRMPEVEVLPACAYYGLGVVPYSPLARGVLTGKYAPDAAAPEGSRAARADKRMLETEFRKESMAHAARIAEQAKKRGITPGQFAVAWVLASEIVTSVLAGPRTLAQWEEYVGALDYRWTPEDEAFVDALVSPGHPSTPGYSDPAYPFYGRTRAGNPVRSP
jgi:aryl-alcohol dehydrogenase-like predicted oxidoreductase